MGIFDEDFHLNIFEQLWGLSWDSTSHIHYIIWQHTMDQGISQWLDPWQNPCRTDPMNQWVNECVNWWVGGSKMNFCELVSRWINDGVNEWVGESMNQWINESLIQWSMFSWINEAMSEGMDGWMNGWMGELVFLIELLIHWDFLAKAPLLSATSSLRSHLFGLLLLRAASQLALL